MSSKQINRDWTLREERIPRRKDVVTDADGNLCIVVKSEGDFTGRLLWLEDVQGQEIYSCENFKNFRLANTQQTRDFYLSYKKNLGWIPGRIYTIKNKDYPLLLVSMDYDLVKQEMLYVFRDLNTSDSKFLKTLDESLLDKIPEWYHHIKQIAFSEDSSSLLVNHLKIELEERDPIINMWSVSGSELSFSTRDEAEAEVAKWRDRLKIRRISSVLSMTEKKKSSMVAFGEEGFLFITDFEMNSGQPAVFNSRVDAAVALMSLGEATWMNALTISSDRYDI